MTDDLVATALTAAGIRAQLGRDPSGDIVEVRPAGAQEVEPQLQVGPPEHLALDLRWQVGDAQKSVALEPGSRSTTSVEREAADAGGGPRPPQRGRRWRQAASATVALKASLSTGSMPMASAWLASASADDSAA